MVVLATLLDLAIQNIGWTLSYVQGRDHMRTELPPIRKISWDRLGWKDTFDSLKFTVHQWNYAHHAARTQIYTPRVVVNGGQAIVGSNPNQLDGTIAVPHAGSVAFGARAARAGWPDHRY